MSVSTEIIENLPVGIYRTTLEGKIVFCNRAYAQTFGYSSPQDLVNFPIIQFYRNKTDRGVLIQAVIKNGRVIGFPISFLKRDGTPIWCAVSAKAVFDDDGMITFLDGMVRDITADIEARPAARLGEQVADSGEIIFLLDLNGVIRDVNDTGIAFLGEGKADLTGRSLVEFVVPSYRNFYALFLYDILTVGQEEVILSFKDSRGTEHHVELQGVLGKEAGKPSHIKAIGRIVTDSVKLKQERLTRERFEGVLEMAGGVAHKLNQPLTIINNTLDDLMNGLTMENPHYLRIKTIADQIDHLNAIARKIGAIRKYESVDYVAGIKIVDIDRASYGREGL